MRERSHEETVGPAVEEVAIHALGRDAALLMIDVQQSFDSPPLVHRNDPRAEENCARTEIYEMVTRSMRPTGPLAAATAKAFSGTVTKRDTGDANA